MKKIMFLITLFLVSLSTACTSGNYPTLSEEEKIILEGELDIKQARNLRYDITENGEKVVLDELGEKVAIKEGEAGDDFVLFIYLGHSDDEYLSPSDESSVDCPGCQAFYQDVLQPYIEKHQVKIYSCYYQYAYQYTKESYKKPHDNAPKLIVFKQGKMVAQESRGNNAKVFASEEGLDEYLKRYAFLPTMLKINDAQLDNLLASETNKIIYYGWALCGDCHYLEKHYLPVFLKKHPNQAYWYYFDTDFYRSKKMSEPEVWENFVQKTGINLKENGGKVPTIAYYEGGELKAAAVYFNDKLEKLESGAYKVVASYYSDAPFINQVYETYTAYQEATANFHNQKFAEFMEEHLL
ncbi:MAG: hypothetical protein ACOX0I_00400 [Bacilli bacterium]|jgi:hypothetical protein